LVKLSFTVPAKVPVPYWSVSVSERVHVSSRPFCGAFFTDARHESVLLHDVPLAEGHSPGVVMSTPMSSAPLGAGRTV